MAKRDRIVPETYEKTTTDGTAGIFLEFHRAVFQRHPFWGLAISTTVYAAVVLCFGERLAISSNYFVILPVVFAALGYGLVGGMIAGALGLPANLALFAILGHPEYSPASKLIAEISGFSVGTALGYLSEYYRQMESEIRRRVRTEQSLRAALEENRLLLMELHHRVKNNLNVIKSLMQMQRNRSRDPAFLEAVDQLQNRVFAIARAHDRLYDKSEQSEVPPEGYLKDIVDVYAEKEGTGPRIEMGISAGGRGLQADAIIPLGLILNEALSNAMKYAVPPNSERPLVRVRFALEEERWILEVRDNGTEFDPKKAYPAGLGLKIIRGLAGQLEGTVSWSSDAGGGAIFRLEFPARSLDVRPLGPTTERDPNS